VTRQSSREPNGSSERKSSATVLAVRAVLVSSVYLAALAWACDRAGAARMFGQATQGAKLAIESHRLKGPLQIIISIADQRISVYSGDMLVARSVVSTGVPDHPTPMGVFTVIQKQRWHRSNLYSAAPMPFMQRITWSGVALHAGVLPGHPASHGCIRLTEDFAVRLWQLTKLGNRVIIARSDVAPAEISHPLLFAQPRKPDASASLGVPAETLKTAQATAIPAGSDFMKPVNAVGTAAHSATPPQSVAAEPAPGAESGTAAQPSSPPPKPEPISVFISRKQEKLLVRQGFTPLFETPVTIRNPERPLGTHVFTAIERKDESGTMRWTVVSFPDESSARIESVRSEPTRGRDREHDHKHKQVKAPVQPPRVSPGRASAALERIEIPREAADRIVELLSPRSSLIVSDQPLSDETDTDTDFIVLVR
jgi:hypothetical protein